MSLEWVLMLLVGLGLLAAGGVGFRRKVAGGPWFYVRTLVIPALVLAFILLAVREP